MNKTNQMNQINPPRLSRLSSSDILRGEPLCRKGDDEPALLAELPLLFGGKHYQGFGVAELTFLDRNRHVTFPKARQMFFGECQCRRLISRHHVEMQQPLRASYPGVEDMDRVGLRLSHREKSS